MRHLLEEHPALFALLWALIATTAIVIIIVLIIYFYRRVTIKRAITNSPSMSKEQVEYLNKEFEKIKESELTDTDKEFIYKFYDYTGYRQ